MDDLAEIERVAGGLLRQLSSSQRRALMRRLARQMAQSQRDRIAAQRQPDGSGFARRAERNPAYRGRYAVSFLCPSGGGGQASHDRLAGYIADSHRLGRDITVSGLHAALHSEGVHNVTLITPTADIIIGRDQAPHCTGVTVTHTGLGE